MVYSSQSVCSAKVLWGSDGVLTATFDQAQAGTPKVPIGMLVVPEAVAQPFAFRSAYVVFFPMRMLLLLTNAVLATIHPLPMRGIHFTGRQVGEDWSSHCSKFGWRLLDGNSAVHEKIIRTLAEHSHWRICVTEMLRMRNKCTTHVANRAERTIAPALGQATSRRLFTIAPPGATPAHAVAIGATISPMNSVELEPV